MSDVYDDALGKWGIHLQVDKTTEETSELTRELARWHLGYENQDALLEEIADVEIMLTQLRRAFDEERIDEHKQAKLERLRGRLDE